MAQNASPFCLSPQSIWRNIDYGYNLRTLSARLHWAMEVTVLLLAQSVIAALLVTVVVVCCVYGDEPASDPEKDDDEDEEES